MLPIHTILHPTDFSERSALALPVACALARDYGARLVVLHVAAPPPVAYSEGVFIPPDNLAIIEEAKRHLDQVPVGDGIAVERRFEEGDPVEGILRVAELSRADLIVMGTHGRTGLSRLFMGSVAEQVLRKAPCPVLTLKAPFAATAPAEAEAGAAVALA
jgi:nucleotide-binding universal stress UspA family protein